MRRIEPSLVVLALIAGCGASQSRGSDTVEPSRAEVEPAASATPLTPSRDAVVRAMHPVMDALAACVRGAHGEASVVLLFDSSGGVVDASIHPEHSWASTQPGPGCDPTPDAHGHYGCRRPRTPVPGVDECIVRAARTARVPSFSRPSFRVIFPLRY